MPHELTPSARTPIAHTETLEQLAERANQAHAQAVAAVNDAVQQALAAGQALLEAKKRCRPGTWSVWLTENFRGSIRTAQGYMRLAVHAPQMNYDAHGRAHLTYDQLRYMMTGLAATDGRAKPKRNRPAAVNAATPEPSPPPAVRGCGQLCLPNIHVEPEFEWVADSLRQTLRELEALAERDFAREYAVHLFERLRLVYTGLQNLRWFHDWEVTR
ncbi:MAG TPA: hypothetical protein VFW87_26765 [Pirellulales bacterium]|nr:hypothetical protein [Pirellulales bacterium]